MVHECLPNSCSDTFKLKPVVVTFGFPGYPDQSPQVANFKISKFSFKYLDWYSKHNICTMVIIGWVEIDMLEFDLHSLFATK